MALTAEKTTHSAIQTEESVTNGLLVFRIPGKWFCWNRSVGAQEQWYFSYWGGGGFLYVVHKDKREKGKLSLCSGQRRTLLSITQQAGKVPDLLSKKETHFFATHLTSFRVVKWTLRCVGGTVLSVAHLTRAKYIYSFIFQRLE